jgi:hypothetical protein
LLVVGLATAAVLLAAADSGQTKLSRTGKVEIQRASTTGFLRLGKERGYRAFLYMPNRRVVLFYAIRIERLEDDSFGFSYAIYAARNRGNLRHGVVRARFGSLGQAFLRFRRDGRVRRNDPGSDCEGRAETYEYGSFVGRLSFRGEGGFFDVSSPKGRAYLAHSPRLRCEKGAAEPQPRSLRRYVTTTPLVPDDDSIALLYASSHSRGRYVGITAVHPERSPPGADVQLAIVDARPGMAIGHGLYLEGPAGTLLTSLPGAHPATATLAPPKPFYGRADYSEESETWTGTLGVRLAGLRLPLTGPRFRVHLCVVNPVKDRNGCEFFKAESPGGERPARLERAPR